MKKETLEYLIKCGIFSKEYINIRRDVINKKEILMSRKIIENNWNIGSLLPIYKNVDFRNIDQCKSLKKLGDIMLIIYRNTYWNEYDLVFIKGNRFDINIIKRNSNEKNVHKLFFNKTYKTIKC
jgi:hypothetical protein